MNTRKRLLLKNICIIIGFIFFNQTSIHVKLIDSLCIGYYLYHVHLKIQYRRITHKQIFFFFKQVTFRGIAVVIFYTRKNNPFLMHRLLRVLRTFMI